MTANQAPYTMYDMASPTHAVSTAARIDLLSMLREAIDPLTLSDRRERVLKDCIEMLEEDNFRAGYAKRFWARVIQRDDGHWIWTGAGQDRPDGRPICDFEGKRVYAAKVAWLLTRLERIPEDEALKKLCKVNRCVTPDCHRRILRVDAVGGRPPAVRRDDHGRPVCKKGHLLKREPKPREHIYCAPCEQQKRIDHDVAERARANVQRFQQRSPAPTPFSLPEPVEDDPVVISSPPDGEYRNERGETVAEEVDRAFDGF